MAYTREEKAEALALMRTGVSAQRAAKELGLQPRTVQIWAKRFREISPEEMPKSIRDEDLKIVQRAQDLIHEAFDEIEETGDARKYLIPLNAVKGTAQDKDFRTRGSQPSTPITITFNVRPTDAIIPAGDIRVVASERLGEPADE
jgi:hypothetical protein